MSYPLDGDYYQMMKNRIPIESRYEKTDFMNIETKLLYVRLLKLILECENRMEQWRVDLETLVHFSVREIFDKIDVMRRSYLTKQDVSILD